MTLPPDLRRSRILEWLADRQTLTIDDLAERLSVSTMTVHRDLDWLAERRRVVKVHGAARLADEHPTARSGPRCDLCERAIPYRTAFRIRTADGQTLHACCAHCGLLLLNEHADAASALARDFLYGRMVNVRQAAYLIDSSVSACCVPSVLCFATEDDARRFETGFGGQTKTFDEALGHLLHHHHGDHHAH